MSTALVLTTRRPVVNHFSKTIAVSESFMRAASNVENGECAYLQKLRENCPGYTFVRSKSRKPSKGQKKILLVQRNDTLTVSGLSENIPKV